MRLIVYAAAAVAFSTAFGYVMGSEFGAIGVIITLPVAILVGGLAGYYGTS